MSKLSWISDDDLILAVQTLLNKAAEIKNLGINRFHKNVVDPFSSIFTMAGFGLDYESWHASELTRQIQKSLQNHVGEFHQEIIGYCNNWQNLETGNIVDLKNDNLKIIAEVKNKYNTVTGSKLKDVYDELDDLVMKNNSIYNGYTAYFVNIIPRNPNRFDKLFTPSINTKTSKSAPNELIRIIDGASFYTLVTNDNNALYDLYMSLPELIEDINGTQFSLETKENLFVLFKKAFDEIISN